MTVEIDPKTYELLDKVFLEGVLAASRDRATPEGQETVCPYEDERMRWWIRGYKSQAQLTIANINPLTINVSKVNHAIRAAMIDALKAIPQMKTSH